MCMYDLYYNPFTPVDLIKSELTLDVCLKRANRKDMHVLRNMVRLNWMVHDLKSNIICKPILLRNNFEVFCGDTRMMAVKMNAHIKDVPALLQVDDNTTVGSDWIKVQNVLHLAELIGTTPENIIYNQNWNEQPLEWIEFAMPHTVNHMHDEQQRERMISNYLNKYPGTIFDQDWCCSKIDWSLYDH